MTSLTYRRPALDSKLNDTRSDRIWPPANGLVHEGKLNFGPALLLAALLSAGGWAILFSLGAKLL